MRRGIVDGVAYFFIIGNHLQSTRGYYFIHAGYAFLSSSCIFKHELYSDH